MASGLLTARWGIFLSALAVLGLAVLGPRLLRGSETRTYCYNGVRTGTGEDRHVKCFEVADGVFTGVRPARGWEELLPGHVIPGLWDGHGHLLQYGEFLHSVDLFGSASFDEVNGRIAAYVEAAAPGVGSRDEWIRGVGWDQMALGGMPSAEMFDRDERLKGLYIMVDRVDVHCAWVSPAVLALLPDDVADVPGGEIVREPGMGVFCDNAMDLVTALWPKPDGGRKKQFVQSAMRKLHEVGLVGMHDAGATPQNLALFDSMASDKDGSSGWTLRVYAMLECRERNGVCVDEAARVRRAGDDRGGGLLTIRSVKLFADGALGSWGSAMLEPYSDRPDTSGSMLTSAEALSKAVHDWAVAGWQVNVHAIGDLANRVAVDSMEDALAALCPEWLDDNDGLHLSRVYNSDEQERRARSAVCQHVRHRFRIEHAQIVHPDDQRRILELGLVPSIQPTHATSDMAYAELRLGAERTRTEAYRMRSLVGRRSPFLSRNASVVLGSDFPVEPPDPFQGIYAAVARRSPHTGRGPEGWPGGWHGEEALTLDQALAGFTRDVAYGAFMEDKAGVIRKGAYADWVVLDRPLESYDVEELRSLKVRETWVGGKRVFARGQDGEA